MVKKIFKILNLWLPPFVWALMIFKFSSGRVPMASESYWLDFAVKKIGHAILYATLAILVYRALIGSGVKRKNAALSAFLITFFYGATDEFHQMYTQGREARIRDVLIDGMGAGTAMYFIYKFVSIFPKKVRDILIKAGIK